MTELQALPEIANWEMWPVPVFGTLTCTWHARPIGSPQAVVHSHDVPGLVTAAAAWLNRSQDEIDNTVADLRRNLDETPEKHAHARNFLEARIDTELTALRSRAGTP
jgi:hypothetical protein